MGAVPPELKSGEAAWDDSRRAEKREGSAAEEPGAPQAEDSSRET